MKTAYLVMFECFSTPNGRAVILAQNPADALQKLYGVADMVDDGDDVFRIEIKPVCKEDELYL